MILNHNKQIPNLKQYTNPNDKNPKPNVMKYLEVISQIPCGDNLTLGSNRTFVCSELSGVFMR